VTALLCVAMALIYAVAFRRMRLPRTVWVAAFATAAFLLLVGPVAAASAGGPLMGLLERFTIGAYLAWVSITCLVLSRVPRREASLRPDPDSGLLREAHPAPAGEPRAR
jgi:hypothetical protein